MSVVSRIWVSCHMYECRVTYMSVVSRTWVSCHDYECRVTYMSVVSRMWVSCHVCECRVTYMSVVSRIWVSCHVYESVSQVQGQCIKELPLFHQKTQSRGTVTPKNKNCTLTHTDKWNHEFVGRCIKVDTSHASDVVDINCQPDASTNRHCQSQKTVSPVTVILKKNMLFLAHGTRAFGYLRTNTEFFLHTHTEFQICTCLFICQSARVHVCVIACVCVCVRTCVWACVYVAITPLPSRWVGIAITHFSVCCNVPIFSALGSIQTRLLGQGTANPSKKTIDPSQKTIDPSKKTIDPSKKTIDPSKKTIATRHSHLYKRYIFMRLFGEVPEQCDSRNKDRPSKQATLKTNITYMFLISKCRGESDLGLCTFWVLAKREPLRNGTSGTKRVSPAGKIEIWHCAVVLFSQVPKKCTDLDVSLLYNLILGAHGKFACENNFLALGVCFPQTCTSAGCRFSASRSRLHYTYMCIYIHIHSVWVRR